MDMFCLDTLACCASLYYVLTNYEEARTMMLIGLVICSLGNLIAFLHTITALIHRRTFFTPMDKFGPLSFFKLTHEAFRGAIPRLQKALASIDLAKPEGHRMTQEFAASYNLFVMLHEEHAKHEDTVIFKTFEDFFPGHAKQSTEEHEHDVKTMEEFREMINKVLNMSVPLEDRQAKLVQVQNTMPAFFEDFLPHIRYEEDNLQPIGRKFIPLALQKEMARSCFLLTSAARWEIIIPYILHNMPRHMQRVRFLKAMCWSMPERSQQFGAIVYRNVDAVMWERLRIEIPEMIPRGETNWRRYW